MKQLRFLFLCGLAFSSCVVRAQERPRNVPGQAVETWFSAGMEFKPFKKSRGRQYEKQFFRKFRAALEVGYRSADILSQGKNTYTTLGAKYRFTKFLRIGAEHRYTFRDRFSNDSQRSECHVQLSHDFGRIGLDYRVRYQHEYIPVPRIRDLLRNALSIEWNVKKFPFDPSISVESFTAMHFRTRGLIGMRYTVGVEYSPNKSHQIELGFRYDREIDTSEPLHRYIIVLSYEFDWRKK